jgi:hypothetical protein
MQQDREPRRMATEVEPRFKTLSQEENFEKKNLTERCRNQTPSPSERRAIKMK